MRLSFFSALLGLLLLLGPAGRVAAQCTINTPPCATPFVAVDVATGQPVQALCVGRAVRFELGCGRTVAANLLYYNALPGTNATPANCDFIPAQLATNTYTPTTAGPVTISELANPAPGSGGGVGTVYVRNFQVYATTAPAFTLAPCLHNTVALTIASGGGYDQYFAQANGGALAGPFGAGAAITLPAPAGASITVVGRYLANGLCSGQATQTVPALAAPQTPVLSRLTVASALPGTISLDVSVLPTGYFYDLQRADAGSPTGFRRVQAVAAGSSTISLAGAPAGLYRLGRRDVCRTDSAFSAPVPTLVLSAASLNNVNSLTWQAAGPVAGYTLLRNGTALATLPVAATSYNDAAVTCGTRYTYRLQATTASSTTISNEVAVQTISALAPPPPLLNASFDLRNRLTLTARQAGGAALPTGGQLLYSRQGGPGNLDFAAVPAATDTLRDPADVATLLAASPCYTVRLQDVCGNGSAASPATCPSLLRVEAADPEGLTARLSWSAFQGPGGVGAGVSYRVLTLSPTGAVLATSAAFSGLSYLDPAPPTTFQVLRYRIEASGGGLPVGTVSYSNVASLTRQPRVVVPNAFTPNGDGLNDVLELKGRYLNGFTFVVVDRNGQEAFRATDRSQTWDGTIRGHAPVNGAYVWRFTLRDEAGQEFRQTGTVTILK